MFLTLLYNYFKWEITFNDWDAHSMLLLPYIKNKKVL